MGYFILKHGALRKCNPEVLSRSRVCARVCTGMLAAVMGEMKMETEPEPVRPRVTDSRGVLKQNRDFLDYFWDIAKPERETRLRAVDKLIEHVRHSGQVTAPTPP